MMTPEDAAESASVPGLVSEGLGGVSYEGHRLDAIALPVGGVGTGSISVSGHGRLQDWEIRNRPAKGAAPEYAFLAVWERAAGQSGAGARLLEGPFVPPFQGSRGLDLSTAGLPRFARCRFENLYPFGRLQLSDPECPLSATLEAWNPLLPGDEEASGLPLAVLEIRLTNQSEVAREVSVAACLSSFVGDDRAAWEAVAEGGIAGAVIRGRSSLTGSMALACAGGAGARLETRLGWRPGWKDGLLSFWDSFSAEGHLPLEPEPASPVVQLLSRCWLAPGASAVTTYLLTWYFPLRVPWARPAPTIGGSSGEVLLGTDIPRQVRNHYATRFSDAWGILRHAARHLPSLARGTRSFAASVWQSALPAAVRDAAMSSLVALRSETTFRPEDGRLYGWEGCDDAAGCCYGTCTHVWNYEWATPLLFGRLARSMRETEFLDATRDDGMMSFRAGRPDSGRDPSSFAAADGQLGCLVKLYREWRLSSDDGWLRRLWPRARAALRWSWAGSGWDRDRDGLPEGCQHHTLDVEYLGPNPLVGFWYLAALRAGEEMADHLGDRQVASTCHRLFESGAKEIVARLFNGEYFEQQRPPSDIAITPEVARPEEVESLREDLRAGREPPHQVGPGCLVDQLLGQVAARLSGLGTLVDPSVVAAAARAVYRYNFIDDFGRLANPYRTFATAGDAGLVMVSYPRGGRPQFPVAYFSEAMSGFEYTAAAALVQGGREAEGLRCVEAIRARYDGHRRNPFDEAECGHHYVRPMASWAVVLALTGFRFAAEQGALHFRAAPRETLWPWGTGYAWGTIRQRPRTEALDVELSVTHGELPLRTLAIEGMQPAQHERGPLRAGDARSFVLRPLPTRDGS